MNATIVRDQFRAFVRVHVLHHADVRPVFGFEMIEALRRHGYAMSPGTLHPPFHGMEKSGFPRSGEESASGKRWKYDKTTAKGRRMPNEARSTVRELVAELLET